MEMHEISLFPKAPNVGIFNIFSKYNKFHVTFNEGQESEKGSLKSDLKSFLRLPFLFFGNGLFTQESSYT
ncbi:hypothetical protein [Bacillus sp. JJ722]|uniref:hypothetical protein n=1 Tax=Bacillus sp. JJ722 TaxID=3122973 RepID=UPI002FFF9A1A